jgi:MFS family permease
VRADKEFFPRSSVCVRVLRRPKQVSEALNFAIEVESVRPKLKRKELRTAKNLSTNDTMPEQYVVPSSERTRSAGYPHKSRIISEVLAHTLISCSFCRNNADWRHSSSVFSGSELEVGRRDMTIASAAPGRFYGWKTLAVVAVMYFAMTGLLLYSFPVFLPFLCQFFGWSRASVSWVNSLAMIVIGIASPFAGMFVTRYGARKAVATGGILCILCFVCAGFHTQLWQLYLAYAVLFGTGGSLCGILAMTTIANNWFVRKRALALSILLTAGGLGGLVMVPFIMSMINRFGWRSTYFLLAALIFVLLVTVPIFLVVNKPEDLGQVPDGIPAGDKKDSSPNKQYLYGTPVDFTAAEAIRTPAFWYLTALATTFMIGMQGFMLHQVAFLLDNNISSAVAATAYSLFVGVSAVGRLAMGFLGLRYSTKSLAIVAMLLLISGMAIILWAKSLPIIFLYNVLIGLGLGGTYVAIMNLMPLYFGKTHYPKIIGFALPFSTILGSIGSPLTGWIRDITGSYRSAWELAILILAIGLVSLILAHPPVHPSLAQNRANPMED